MPSWVLLCCHRVRACLGGQTVSCFITHAGKTNSVIQVIHLQYFPSRTFWDKPSVPLEKSSAPLVDDLRRPSRKSPLRLSSVTMVSDGFVLPSGAEWKSQNKGAYKYFHQNGKVRMKWGPWSLHVYWWLLPLLWKHYMGAITALMVIDSHSLNSLIY